MKKRPQFLNVDFDIFSQVPLRHLKAHFEHVGLSILYAGENHHTAAHEFGDAPYLLSAEVNTSVLCLSILEDFVAVIAGLSEAAKKDWDCKLGLVLDLGFNIPEEARTLSVDVSQDILALAQHLNASLRVTTYLVTESEWDKDHGQQQFIKQSELDSERWELNTHRKYLRLLQLPQAQSDALWQTERPYRALSIHDHVLSHEECLAHFMFYGAIKTDVQRLEYETFEKSMGLLFQRLFETTPILITSLDEASTACQRIESLEALLQSVVHELRTEAQEHCFLLPEYRTVIEPGFDLTWFLCLYEPINTSVIQLAQQVGVHVIEV